MTAPILPGLFDRTAQVAHVQGQEPKDGIKFAAKRLLDALNTCGYNPTLNKLDRKLTEDPRYKLAVTQGVTLSLWLDDRAKAKALDRCILLNMHLRERGRCGLPGLLGRAAHLLGQAAQADNDSDTVQEVLTLIEQALEHHALAHHQHPAQHCAQHQLAALHSAQPHLQLH